jgi:endonuclease YncB( thermonuclease family)
MRETRSTQRIGRLRKARYAIRRGAVPAVLLLLAGAIALGDYVGLFGRIPPPDFPRYHNREVRVTNIVDGDTLDVGLYDPLNDKSTTRIRLWGVDTPETVKPNTPPQHFGPEATSATRRWCKGKTVTLRLVKGDTRGKYKRLLAYVVLPNGQTLNDRLVAEGYAYADPRYDHPRREEYRRLQARAVRDGRGLWKNVTPDDLPYYFHGQLPQPALPGDGNNPTSLRRPPRTLPAGADPGRSRASLGYFPDVDSPGRSDGPAGSSAVCGCHGS